MQFLLCTNFRVSITTTTEARDNRASHSFFQCRWSIAIMRL